MRSIEELAAEENARIREVFWKNAKTVFFLAGVGLAAWGWILFSRGQMGSSTSMITGSFLLLAWSWGGVVKVAFLDGLLAFAVAAPAFIFYYLTRLPSFYWGKDPAFWLSVHAGAVSEPLWSPLAYLVGQLACFLFPQRQWTIPTELSALVMSLALGMAMLDFLSLFKNKNPMNLLLAWVACGLLAIMFPLWNAATMASGLVCSLGLVLFLFLRLLMRGAEPSRSALFLVVGLLGAVQPFWGFLGIVFLLGTVGFDSKKWLGQVVPFLVGLTPYLWIFFRADQFFPSWGGKHPFREFWVEGKFLLQSHFDGEWAMDLAFKAWGWIVPTVGVSLALMSFLYFFKWRTGNKPLLGAVDFWVWVFSGVLASLSFSLSSESLGPVGGFFAFGLLEIFLRLTERGMEKRQSSYFSGLRLTIAALAVLLFTGALAALPGQSCFRGSYFFPQQHALNLLRTLEGRSLLVSEDPFEIAACQEARLFDPSLAPTLLLNEGYLNRKWYVAQTIARQPELLFWNLLGSPGKILRDLVVLNRGSWNIHWARSVMPPDWSDVPASPTVLTQFFTDGPKSLIQPEEIQFRLDLTALPKKEELRGGQERRYFSRYTIGFNELGKSLMAKGLYLASIQAFDRASHLDPTFAEPQSFLSQMYSQQKILEAAQLALEQNIKTQPRKNKELVAALEAAQKDLDEKKCIKILDDIIRLNSETASAQYQLSVIYRRQEKTREANDLLESSLQLNPKQVEAQLTLGHLMVKMGNRLKAEEAFRAALVINPENKEAQVELWKLLNKP